MAEILLSLTIIGVVAAITLPSLTGNINERTWNTQRKALYSRLSQAVALMPQINGYGNITQSEGEWTSYYSYSSDNATDVFIASGLAKVFKLNNVCDAEHLADCGIPEQTIGYGGSKITLTGSALRTIGDLNQNYSSVGCANLVAVHTLAGAFETANGESVIVHYNPVCRGNWTTGTNAVNKHVAPVMLTCANFIYDLNGKKGPNTMGKDMGFMTLFYPTDSVLVSANLVNKSLTYSGNWQGAIQYCKSLGDDSRLANREELVSLIINEKFLSFGSSDWVWSATKEGSNTAWYGEFGHNGDMEKGSLSSNFGALCVRR